MKITPNDREYNDFKEVLFEKMNEFIPEFEIELSKQYVPATVSKYLLVATAFNEYIFDYTYHLRYEDISVANANSRFIAQAKYESLYGWDNKEIKIKLKRFIQFLDKNGCHNPRVLKSLFK